MWRQAFLTILGKYFDQFFTYYSHVPYQSANIGTFFFGVSASWSSPSMRVIVENENYAFWVTKSQFGIVVAAMSFGAMLSCIPSGIVRHKYGTKRTMLIFSFPATIGAIFITLPQNILMVFACFCVTFVLKIILQKFTVNFRSLSNRSNSWMLHVSSTNLCWGNFLVKQSSKFTEFSPNFCSYWDNFHLHTWIFSISSYNEYY